MSDHCQVRFLPGAVRELNRIAKHDPARLVVIERKVEQVEEDGWILSTKSELTKVLRSESCVGEIRDLGSGGYRLFFFWAAGDDGRDLYVSHVLAKSQVTGRARISTVLDAVEKVRERFLREE
ncbi:MAG TPA: hypothetical protein VFJ82_10215 [Longimicrobium sp.]|nr:hypothetical protein [Longimicrobium sp.]